MPTDGMSDGILKMIINAWPEVKHTYLTTTIPRALSMLKDGEMGCYMTSLVGPERERITYMSDYTPTPKLALVARKNVYSKLPKNKEGEVLLDQLFDDAEIRGTFHTKRSITPLFDMLLSRKRADANISFVPPAGNGGNILQMLAADRTDYTIEHEITVLYHSKFNKTIGDADLKLAHPAGLINGRVAIACPRTPWGLQTIKKIDGILTKMAGTPEYLEILTRWSRPETIKREKAEMKAFLQSRALPTNPARWDH